jgi:hypothetical protein
LNRTITVNPRRLFLAGLLGLVAIATYGFAAANTVPGSNGGDGSGAISGYTVSNVHYTLDPNTPTQVNQVSFNLSPAMLAGGTIRISTNGTTFISAACTGTSSITCSLSGAGVTASSLTNLRVVAAQ